MTDEARGAQIRVVKGEPTDEELAALIAVVSATVETGRPEPVNQPSNWAAYWRSVRAPLRPGPRGWRASAAPDRLV